MTPTYTRKGERLYHYYTSMDLIRNRDYPRQRWPDAACRRHGRWCGHRRDAAHHWRTRGGSARDRGAAAADGPPMDERAIVAALRRFNELWEALFPAEQARIVRLLVDRVTVGPDGMAVDLRNNGIAALIRDLNASTSNGGRRMSSPNDTIRVVIPLTIRRRNGRPKILPPERRGRPAGARAGSAHPQGVGPRMGVAAEAGER